MWGIGPLKAFLARARQWLRLHVWHPINAIFDLFHLLPPIAAIVIFALLAYVGQIFELLFILLYETVNSCRSCPRSLP